MASLKHYGTQFHSGRYPYGSGEDPHQHSDTFLSVVRDLRKKGLTEKEIADSQNMTIWEFRARKSIESDAEDREMSARAFKLKEKGLSNVAIGKIMGKNESSIRDMLNPEYQRRAMATISIADSLKRRCDEKTYVDVGLGVEQNMAVTRTKLRTAVAILEQEGYQVHKIFVPQAGMPGKYTTLEVLVPPGVTKKDVSLNREKIVTTNEYSTDGGSTLKKILPPSSLSESRIFVRTKEDGGALKDGVIELRRNVPDLSLDKSKYAQVRIMVDGNKYMKGMAIYSDDIPEGYDIVYNSSKEKGSPKIFKKREEDPDLPFGSVIKRQLSYKDKNGKSELSPINIVNEEGDWEEWSRTISSQVLSKQRPALAKKQLDLAAAVKREEYDEIMSLTNPTIKRNLLQSFAEDCDAAAAHLKAAALPGQANKVILPFPGMKETEVYAPTFRDGEVLALIRHPHGGVFEIAEVTVNNRNPKAKAVMAQARDAIGIHPKVAEKLSGADFDGDTVLAIPNSDRLIISRPALNGLKNFDNKVEYRKYPGMTVMTEKQKQTKMGDISNLITDMTIKGATDDELVRAVKHSMVVIDAVKHELDYKRSYADNGIASLKKKYQGGATRGASTIVSRAKSQARILDRSLGTWERDPVTGKRVYKERINPITGKKEFADRTGIDPNTGKLLYTNTGATYLKKKWSLDPVTGRKVYEKDGKELPKLVKINKMDIEDDARKLSSGQQIEDIYADYANTLKSLGNEARKKSLSVEDIPYSPSAKETFRHEVESLNRKLNIAFKNKPLERQAQLVASQKVRLKRQNKPDMEPDELKKVRGQAIADARILVGAKKIQVLITDKEWVAIQAGAISPNKLAQILLNTDTDLLKERAMPRESKVVSPARKSRAIAMYKSGCTQAEIADALGISVSSVSKVLSETGGN